MTETRDRINLLRRLIGALSDLVWMAVESGDDARRAHYRTLREEATTELAALVRAAHTGGRLADAEAEQALSPIASVGSAHAFR
ncbi:hypothetical protein [Streptomyces chattanoogensis]|uniref:Uncharacterized protein n=1 Tax=Streptomyces chattanoogensis TaxID=66876 RepID=A0A0N0GZ49_9ACTN|nr:hypothetical protein [Streptomyces chattanoogensis]KPC62439.1 hypothetical protein ADL29_19065 [Streptomyces chattanoogensis]